MHNAAPHFFLPNEALRRAPLAIGDGAGLGVDQHAAGAGARNTRLFAAESLARLSRPATELARLLACLDEGAELNLLTALSSKPDHVEKALDEALATGLLQRQHSHYRYSQAALAQAIYQTIPASQRAGLHLRIGRRLLAATSESALSAVLPAILSQLNRGAAGMPMRAERERCARLNLRAGWEARQQAALAPALAYFAAGLSLLDDPQWLQPHPLRFALAQQHAECLLLLGRYAEAGPGLAELARQAASPADRGTAARLQIGQQAALNRPDRALAIAATELARGGLHLSLPANDGAVMAAIADLWSELARDGAGAFTDTTTAPGSHVAVRPEKQARIDAMGGVLALSLRIDQPLCLQMVARSLQAGRQHGGDAGAGAAMALAYVAFGIAAGQRDDCAQHAYALGRHGLALARRDPRPGTGAAAKLFFAQLLMPWHAPLVEAQQALRAALERAVHDCEPLVAAQARLAMIDLAMARGEPLASVQMQLETALRQLHGGFAMAAQLLATRLALVRGLRGHDGDAGDDLDEQLAVPPQALAARSHWIRQLQALFYRGDHRAALRAAAAAQALLERSPPDVEYAECAFFSALCHAALHDGAPAAERQSHRQALAGQQAALARLLRHRPDNFAPMTALLAAEAASADGLHAAAGDRYRLAVASAVEHGMPHIEALAHELAARRCARAQLADAADTHLCHARRAYLRWGAQGRAAQLAHREIA
jgi:hypothetical protein